MSGERDLEAHRARIEQLDRAIVGLVAQRLEAARAIGRLKRDRATATLDPGREAAVVRSAVERGREMGLPPEAVRDLFWTVVELCRNAQMDEG